MPIKIKSSAPSFWLKVIWSLSFLTHKREGSSLPYHRISFHERNRNLCQARNEQHDCLHPSSSKAFCIYSSLASHFAHKWTVPDSMCLHSRNTNTDTCEADIGAPLRSFLGGKVKWQEAIIFLFGMFCC